MDNARPKDIRVVVSEVLRVTHSCDSCRKKKIKCDGKSPCQACLKSGRECVISLRTKKRGPQKPRQKLQTESPSDDVVNSSNKDITSLVDILFDGNLNVINEIDNFPNNECNNNTFVNNSNIVNINNFVNDNNNYVNGNNNDNFGNNINNFVNNINIVNENANLANCNNTNFVNNNSSANFVNNNTNNSNSIVLVNSHEQNLLCDMEVQQYFYDFFAHVAPIVGPFSPTRFIDPKTPPQFLAKYSMCAFSARARGFSERATQFVELARSFSGASFDKFSLDSVLGFLLLGVYFQGTGSAYHLHYYSVAGSITRILPSNTVPPAFEYLIKVLNTVLISGVPYTTTGSTLMAISNAVQGTDKWTKLRRIWIRVMAHVFFAFGGCMTACVDVYDAVFMSLSKIVFTKNEARDLLEDIAAVEILFFGDMCSHADRGGIKNHIRFMTQLLRMMVKWHAGDTEEGLNEAIEAAKMCSFEFIRYCPATEEGLLLWLVILLQANAQFELATKVYNITKDLHKITLVDTPLPTIPGINSF